MFVITATLGFYGGSDAKELGLDLTIFLDTDQKWQDKKNGGFRDQWRDACNNLKSLFENPQGKFGHGPFLKASCAPKPKKLQEIAKSSSHPSWLMRVIDNEQQSGIEIYFLSGKNPRIEAAQLGTSSEKFLEGLTHKKVAIQLSLILQDRLPIFTVVNIEDDDARQIDIESPVLPDPSPDEFVVYSLVFDESNEIWQPTFVGVIKSETSGMGRQIKWKIKLHRGSFKKGTVLFAHNAMGRGKAGDGTEGRLSTLLRRFGVTTLAEGLMMALSENLTGFRYGYQILGAPDIVGKSNMLSLFTEVRAGALKGLRFYYDSAPKVSEPTPTGEKTWFGWSATNVGWAFSMSTPSWASTLVNRVDVQPKIGLMSLDMQLYGIDDWGMEQTAEFKMKSTVYGGELGMERDVWNMAMLRGWTGFFYSSSTIGISKINFLSLRAGIDTYWDLTSFGPFKIKGLAFGSMENLSIGKQFDAPADNRVVDRGDTLTKVTYQLKFLGLGVTVAW